MEYYYSGTKLHCTECTHVGFFSAYLVTLWCDSRNFLKGAVEISSPSCISSSYLFTFSAIHMLFCKSTHEPTFALCTRPLLSLKVGPEHNCKSSQHISANKVARASFPYLRFITGCNSKFLRHGEVSNINTPDHSSHFMAQRSSTGMNPRFDLFKMILHQIDSELRTSHQRNRTSYSCTGAYLFH